MRHHSRAARFSLAAVLLVSSGCGFGVADSHDVFQSLYGIPIPPNVKVAHYYGETLGMDPSFAWQLEPLDNPFLKQVVQSQALTRAGKDDRPGPVYKWPRWWNDTYIQALPEVYYKEGSGLYRIWVDRAKERMFVEFIGTVTSDNLLKPRSPGPKRLQTASACSGQTRSSRRRRRRLGLWPSEYGRFAACCALRRTCANAPQDRLRTRR